MQLGEREVVTQGLRPAVFQDLYHFFMTVSWPRLFATIAAFFLAFDVLFGCLYYLVPGCIANLNPPGFAGAFFFSVETLGTVGYGEMHPQTLYGHIVSMIEIFVGLMTLALITGLMFARFSRPRARFLFAANAVVRPIGGRLTLMFRAANARQNIIQEASAQLRMLRDEHGVTVPGPLWGQRAWRASLPTFEANICKTRSQQHASQNSWRATRHGVPPTDNVWTITVRPSAPQTSLKRPPSRNESSRQCGIARESLARLEWPHRVPRKPRTTNVVNLRTARLVALSGNCGTRGCCGSASRPRTVCRCRLSGPGRRAPVPAAQLAPDRAGRAFPG